MMMRYDMNIFRWCCNSSVRESPVVVEEKKDTVNPIVNIFVTSIQSENVSKETKLRIEIDHNQHVSWGHMLSPGGTTTIFTPDAPKNSPLSFPLDIDCMEEKHIETTEEDKDYTLDFSTVLTKQERETKAQLYWERYKVRQDTKIKRILSTPHHSPIESFLPDEGEPGNRDIDIV